MAGDSRARFSQEIYRPDSPSSQYGYRPHSPGGFSTPTSATFSTGQNSPRWGSGMQSPISSHSRTASLYAGHRTPGRRLSVPSAGNPFQSPHGGSFGPPVLGQINSSNIGSFSPSSSMVASPTTSTAGSTWSRRESISSASDEAWRRRTWHPETYSNYTSRLQNVITPNYYSNGPPPQAPVVPSNAPPLQQTMRLPGIESFDPLPRPTTPARRQPSPMMIDTPSRVPAHQEPYQNERPNSQHWDMGINRNLNRLDIAQGTPDTASSWASEANSAVQAQAEQARAQPAVRFEESPYSARPQTSSGSFHQHTISAPPITPKSAKRQGWYSGPLPGAAQAAPGVQMAPVQQRTSPADSSSSEGGVPGTPRSNVGDVNPGIVHSSGWVDHRNGNGMIPAQHQQHPPNGYVSYPTQQSTETGYNYGSGSQHGQMEQQPQGSNMLRLEALVAVATAKSEENVAIHA
jgi:C2H2 transcription facotor